MERDEAAAAADGAAPQPPEHIRQGAHVAGNGELLWPRSGAIAAANWIASSGLGIWGGEVYAPRGPFTAVMVNEWRTEPELDADEPWAGYVSRGLEQAIAAIGRYPATGRADEALYFLAYHSPFGFAGETQTGQRRAGPLVLDLSTQNPGGST
ncbi:MAG TPA: hypothetical protein VFD88_07445 [Clostridia bacterium]|nr:hypothetical protein [Clostridia bacterium]